MRKGIDSLSGIVRSELKKDPLGGDLFIFLTKRKNQVKMLHWRGDGFAIFYKRLEKGRYEMLSLNSELNHTFLSSEQLLYILQEYNFKASKNTSDTNIILLVNKLGYLLQTLYVRSIFAAWLNNWKIFQKKH